MESFAGELTRRKHDVAVITAKPSHPAGVVFDGYEDGFFVDSEHEGVPVTHCWIVPDWKKTVLSRLLFYASFVITSILAASRLERDYDVVLASSPPLSVGVSGWIVARLVSADFVFDVRDLWPDLAVAMGMLPEGPVARMAGWLERFIYRRADAVTAVTEAFCRTIRERVPADTPVERVSNGTEPDRFRVEAPSGRLREDLGLPDGFLVTYAGNVGLCQGLAHVLDAADRLAETRPRVRILFLGDGPVKAELAEEARERGLPNVHFRDRVPLDRAVRVMAASDALLVPLADHDIYRSFIPSKLFDAMAVGRPVLLSVDGEAREILDEARAGVFYPPEDGEALARAVMELEGREDLEKMGERGRQFVSEHYTREEQARRLVRFLDRVAGDGGSPGRAAGAGERGS